MAFDPILNLTLAAAPAQPKSGWRSLIRRALVVLMLTVPVAALGHEFKIGDLEIVHPYIAPPAPMAKSAAAYVTIVNHGADDSLTGVEITGVNMAMLHATETSAEGMTSMAMIPSLAIPAGATVKLEAGQMHIMLTGLSSGFSDWDMVKGTLIFANAGRVEIEFMIDPDGASEHEH